MKFELIGYYLMPFFAIICCICFFILQKKSLKQENKRFTIQILSISFGYLVFATTMFLLK